jgi:hypothetical protein
MAYRSIICSGLINTVSGTYLELGSFFGCGSTQDVLQTTLMRCICVDSFSIPYTCWADRQAAFRPQSAVPGLRLNQMPYFKGQGTHLDHFMNNTWEYRSRVLPMQCNTKPEVLEAIYDAGVVPDLIFVDDDHSYEAVRWRLAFISEHWPSATVVCDDYNEKDWPGVVEAVQQSLANKSYAENKSKQFSDRLYLLRG